MEDGGGVTCDNNIGSGSDGGCFRRLYGSTSQAPGCKPATSNITIHARHQQHQFAAVASSRPRQQANNITNSSDCHLSSRFDRAMKTARSDAGSFAQTEINWDKLDKTKFYVLGAGIFSGLTIGLYPISVVKTRMQIATKDSVEKNAYAVIRGLLKTEGIRGLCLGFGTVITGAVPSRIVLLTTLETTKADAFKVVEPFELSETLEAAIANGIAGMTASLFAQFVFVPIDVVSQRLMVQGYSGYASYNGGLDVARQVLKQDPGALQRHHKDMGVLCRLFGHGTNSNRAVPSEGTIVLVQGTGGICGAAATSLIITPLDTIKTRLQVMSHEKQPSTQQVIKALVSKMAGRVYI
ncbi:hypothetical protein E3N88_06810 [Mikania micrantha]|uniref:Uncharacterized protein n=1 Tax=Mikania micrantha TaxID=192012 RepID=A0A5N6PPN9_9ASTR|nr:hypothetical protein E3N88_06810 [Mikania micrantha]